MTRRRSVVVTLVSAYCLCLLACLTSSGTTFASWSDYKVLAQDNLGADRWSTPPAACGASSNYKGGVVYGTFGDDVLDLRTAHQAQIIMALGGNDTIYGGNSGDCLVGGDGDDKLYGGNAKDILIGGPGDDYLDGGNGKDALDGGGDVADICDGGNGKDTVTNCGSAS
jgi:Ca2+-binding RTX toxin-like protein